MSRRAALKREDDRQEPPLPEKILMVVSALFVLVLLAYLGWKSYEQPEGEWPVARVLDARPVENGTVVDVELANLGDVGILEVAVEVLCDDPPPTLTFANVPAGGATTGSVVCPAGTGRPETQVAWWIPT